MTADPNVPIDEGWYWRHQTGIREPGAQFYLVCVERRGIFGDLWFFRFPHGPYEKVVNDMLWFGPVQFPDDSILR